MGTEKLVTILIPVYNREILVKRAIECSIKQTYPNIEIILGDNCSTDRTWEVLQDYRKNDPRIQIFRNEENLGPVRNWIECSKRANGEYVKILFSDDWMDLDWIEKAVRIINDNANIGFVYSAVNIVSRQENQIFVFFKTFNYNKIFNTHLFLRLSVRDSLLPVSPGCFLFRKKDVLVNLRSSLPGTSYDFNTNGAGSDLLLILLTAKNYKKIAFLKDSVCYFLDHKDAFSYIPSSIIPIYQEVKKYMLPYHNNCLSILVNNIYIYTYRILRKLKFI
jgi:glycosyltransferase involved in cell wall biosynthesis